MTSKSRRSGGGPAKPADEQAQADPEGARSTDNTGRDGEQPAPEQPEKEKTDGGNAAGDEDGAGPTVSQQAATGEDVLRTDGDPVPAEVDRGMVREETGISPEPFVLGSEDEAVATAPTGDDERNGKPLGIGTDTSGELRRRDGAVPTAATGHGNPANGAPVNMGDQLDKRFGDNGDPAARLEGSGVRAERGVGTLDRDLEDDERPTYPSTTLTRATPDAAPMEPDDVKRATEPKYGDVQTSTDPIAAASAIRSQAGDDTVELVGRDGQTVKPSEFFEVPDGPLARSFMRVNQRVSEVYTIRHAKDPNRRLLFTEDQMVPVAMAETLISLHG